MSATLTNLPARAKIWRVKGNSVQAAETTAALHAAQAWLNIKGLFLATPAAMSCAGSCNSVAAGMDGVDRIVAKADVVSNVAGAHSWQVLECVQAGWQICIDFNTANNYTGTLVWSPGGLFTGGSTTARPTASDEIVNRSSTDWCLGNATTRVNWTLIESEDGQNFILTGGLTGTLSVCWMIGRIQDARSYLTLPFYCNQMSQVAISSNPNSYFTLSGGNSWAFSVRVPTSPFIARCQLTCQSAYGHLIFDGSVIGYGSSSFNTFTGGYDVVQPGLYQSAAPNIGRYGTLPDHLHHMGIPHGTIVQDRKVPSIVGIALGTWVLPWPAAGAWQVP